MPSNLTTEQLEQLQSVELVTFDLDDTLWPLESVLISAEQAQYEWLEENAPRITKDVSMQDLMSRRYDFLSTRPDLTGDVTAMRKQSLLHLFSSFDYSDAESQTMVNDAFDVFYRARSQVTLFDDAPGCLQTLKSHYKLAALTNGNADLEIAGIAHLFDDARFATLDTPAKPDVAMFHQSAAALDVDPKNMLHVGDNVETDVGGGQRAGALTAWYNPEKKPWPDSLPPPTLDIARLNDLLTYLPKVKVS